MIRCAAIFLLLFTLSAYPQVKKGKAKPPKPPDVMMLKPVVHMEGGVVTFDGRVGNSSDKPIKAMILVIDFLGPKKELLTTWRGPIESELLEPGEESAFALQVKCPQRAVSVRFNAVDADGRDLRLDDSGPFEIK